MIQPIMLRQKSGSGEESKSSLLAELIQAVGIQQGESSTDQAGQTIITSGKFTQQRYLDALNQTSLCLNI